MLALSDNQILGLLPAPALIAAVEAAARALESGKALSPKRLHIDWEDKTALAMPAVSTECFGTKLVSVMPGNAAQGLPVINGLMILNDARNGLPLAIMNAAALTAQRTGAVGALGVKYMTPANTHSIGIVGCGVQGAWQAIAACAVRPLKDVFGVSRSESAWRHFTATVGRHAPWIHITRCKDARDLLSRTDVVIAATTSATPVLPDDPALLEGKHFISIGSFKPTMQELPDAVYKLAGELAIDSEAAREEVGDVIGPVRKGLLDDRNVFHIAQLVTGKRSVDTAGATAYKTVGLALYDVFAAQALYDEARRRGIGQEIEI